MGAISRAIAGSVLIYIAVFGFYVPYVTGPLSLVSGIDLYCDIINTQAVDQTNLTWIIRVSVRNRGTNDSGPFRVALYENATNGAHLRIQDYLVESLASGNSTFVPETIIPLSVGSHVIVVVVDSDEQVNETDETNNEAQVTLVVIQSTSTGNGDITIPNFNFTFPNTGGIIEYILNFAWSLLEMPNIIIQHPVLKGILFITGFYMLATGVASVIKKKDD